jgi:acyl-[acyl-carrier-protein]-phospholipid O-acyltransferase/long-chain-fatty-acid--[acyl-carrier-protein] ligase
MRARRFAGLFWCQFLSVFNDHYVRNMLAMLILFRLDAAEGGALITLAIGTFIAPALFLSGLGGELADAHDKAWLARRLKFAEILVQLVAALGLVLSSLFLLYAALFGLGVISALFGPVKYGILPDLLPKEELLAGNALVEAATFVAIFLGLIVGGLSVAGRTPEGTVLQLLAIAFACFAASLFIPPAGRGAAGLRANANVLRSTRERLSELARDAKLWRRSVAVSWFWMSGAVALSLVPVVVRNKAGGGIEAETAVSALFAFGIGVGSLAAAVIARGRIYLKTVPFAALAMAVFLIDLGGATYFLPMAGAEAGFSEFFRSFTGIRVASDVVGLACAGGLFVVPLFTAIQAEASKDRRARIVAGVNILSSAFIVVGSLATAMLQSSAIGITEPALLAGLGALNLGAAFYVKSVALD